MKRARIQLALSSASNLGNGSSESGFAVIDVPNGTDVYMGLPATNSTELGNESHEPMRKGEWNAT